MPSCLIFVLITLIVMAILWAFEIVSFNFNRPRKKRAFWKGNYLFTESTGECVCSVYQSFRDEGLWFFQGGGVGCYGGYVSRAYAMRAAESFFQVEIVNEPRGRNGDVKDND